MDNSLGSIDSIYKQLHSCISSIFKIKEQIQGSNKSESEDIFYRQQTIKEEFYKKTMNLSSEQYKKLSHTLLESSKRDVAQVCSQLNDVSDVSNCWDCDHLMCYGCMIKLEQSMILLQDIINKNSNVI